MSTSRPCGRIYDGSTPGMERAVGTSCVCPLGPGGDTRHSGLCGNAYGSWPYEQGVDPPIERDRVRPEWPQVFRSAMCECGHPEHLHGTAGCQAVRCQCFKVAPFLNTVRCGAPTRPANALTCQLPAGHEGEHRHGAFGWWPGQPVQVASDLRPPAGLSEREGELWSLLEKRAAPRIATALEQIAASVTLIADHLRSERVDRP